MTPFVDAKGRTWKVSVTTADLPAVRRAVGLGPDDALTASALFERLSALDPESAGRLLWELCQGQAAGDVGDFLAGLDAEANDRALLALVTEVVGFFHRAGRGAVREALPAVWARLDAAAAEQIRARLNSISSGSPGNSPGSSGSTPAP